MPSNESSLHSMPLQWVGPVCIAHPFTASIKVPLATYETTLWPSVARGARVSQACSGIHVQVQSHAMTRSILVEASNAMQACQIERKFQAEQVLWQQVVQAGSRYAKFLSFHSEVVGPLIFLRLAFSTGDASGHNMATKAAESILNFILQRHSDLRYVSLSGNYCADKKVSAINGILGRGFRIVAEVLVKRSICEKMLRTTPEAIVALHIRKNLIGSILAGSLRSANAHFANMLLAFFLATGQDGANIVEGSQGLTHAQITDSGDLAFSCSLPSLIVGSVGHGKSPGQGHASQGGPSQAAEHLERLGCLGSDLLPGQGAERLAVLAASVVLCGELSLMGALTRPGELMRAHQFFERRG